MVLMGKGGLAGILFGILTHQSRRSWYLTLKGADMSNLKVGDLVMIGGAATAEDRAKNAGRFRTVVGFVPAGFEYKDNQGDICCRQTPSAVLDGNMFSLIVGGPGKGEWSESPHKGLNKLVKISPGEVEDETFSWVGKPSKQTKEDKKIA